MWKSGFRLDISKEINELSKEKNKKKMSGGWLTAKEKPTLPNESINNGLKRYVDFSEGLWNFSKNLVSL